MASKIPLDHETQRTLHAAGYDYSSILPAGEHLFVRRTANLHTGGTLEDVTAILHPTSSMPPCAQHGRWTFRWLASI